MSWRFEWILGIRNKLTISTLAGKHGAPGTSDHMAEPAELFEKEGKAGE